MGDHYCCKRCGLRYDDCRCRWSEELQATEYKIVAAPQPYPHHLTPPQVAILKAALLELDKNWRRGTANAGFSEEAWRLLRGEFSPHESEVERLYRLLSAPGLHAVVVSTTYDGR